MDKFVIRGGNPLLGTIRISGAKNAALPAMAAALLTDEAVILENIPQVRDIETERRLLAAMGAEVELGYGRAQHRTTICAANLSTNPEASYELVKTMRASSLVLGPLVARVGFARVSIPGGCAIGARPIDLHIKGLEKLGAKIVQEHGYIEARANEAEGRALFVRQDHRDRHGRYSDGGGAGRGRNGAGELRARARGGGSGGTAGEDGGRDRGRGNFDDQGEGRGEAARRAAPDHSRPHRGGHIHPGRGADGRRPDADRLRSYASDFPAEQAGRGWREGEGGRGVRAGDGRRRSGCTAADITTEEYPGFPTDVQAQYMALVTQAAGTSVITENIFENRFMHAQELCRMGANIKIEGRRAVVRGKSTLSGAAVLASDLRASASLVLAALVAQDETIIDRVYHIDRGYERIEEKLRGVGAQMKRIGEILPRRVGVWSRNQARNANSMPPP